MQRQIVTLYIHPMQGGPVTQVRWDVPKIHELLGEGFDQEMRIEGRTRELARQILLCCPKVHPEHDWPKLQYIVRNLIKVDHFDGIVLHLSGTIDGGDEQAIEEIVKMKEEISRLHQAVQSERQQRIQWQSKAQSYETRVLRLQRDQSIQAELFAENQGLHEELRTMRSQLVLLQGKLAEAQQDIGIQKAQIELLTQEHKTQMENLKRGLKKKAGGEQEVRELRRDLQNAQTKSDHLEETNRRLEEAIEHLQAQNRPQLDVKQSSKLIL